MRYQLKVQNDLNNKQVCPCWIKHQDKMSIVLSMTVVWANLDTLIVSCGTRQCDVNILNISRDVLNVLMRFQHCWTYHMLTCLHNVNVLIMSCAEVLSCDVAWINVMSTRWPYYVQHHDVFNNYSKVDAWMCQQCIMHMFLRVGGMISERITCMQQPWCNTC